MTRQELYDLLDARLAYIKARPPADDFWGHPAPPRELRLASDDTLIVQGYTVREVRAVDLTGCTRLGDKLDAIRDHWLAVWTKEEADKQAAKEAAAARQALWESQAPERARLAKERAAQDAAAEAKARWVRLGPPGSLKHRKAGDLLIEFDEQRKAAEIVAATPHKLWFVGTPGTGKSSYAALWLRKQFEEGEDVRWVSCFDFNEAVSGRGDDDLLEDCEWVGGLVVDDIEEDRLTDKARTALAELVDRRRDNGNRTCITTNLTPAQLKGEVFTPRNYSRLFGGAVVIPMVGRDYRLNPLKAST